MKTKNKIKDTKKMKTIESILRKEKWELEKTAYRIRDRLKDAPKGYLRIRKKRGYMEYYYVDKTDSSGSNGKYVKNKEKQLVKTIAQRDYDKVMLQNVEARMTAINVFLQKYEETNPQRIYSKMHPFRKVLLSEVILPDEEYVRQWESVEYEGKPFASCQASEEAAGGRFFGNESEIITERGERVRSKSEKIIADKLYALGIPYRYECPLALDGGITMFPDFTILKRTTREEVYLEHFGKMDDENYVSNVLLKLNTYAKNSIYPGIRLFFTYETGRQPLNTRVLDGFLREFLDI